MRNLKKFILISLVVTTLADIFLTYQAIKMHGSVQQAELNLLIRELLNLFGVKVTMFLIIPVYLFFLYVILFYFWIPRFKYLYIFLAIVKLATVIFWLVYFVLYLTSGPIYEVA